MNPKRTYTALVAFLAALLAGCQTIPYEGVTTTTQSREASAGEGYLFLSFTFAGEPKPEELPLDANSNHNFNRYIFKIRNVDDPYQLYEVGLRSTSQGGYYRDFDVRDGMGFVFLEPLPAGEYEIYSYEVSNVVPLGLKVYQPQSESSFRFQIEAQKATYIGRIQAEHKYGFMNQNRMYPNGIDFTWSKTLSEDITRAYMKFPHLISTEIIESPIENDIQQLNSPLSQIATY